jgi:hypothetical protein
MVKFNTIFCILYLKMRVQRICKFFDIINITALAPSSIINGGIGVFCNRVMAKNSIICYYAGKLKRATDIDINASVSIGNCNWVIDAFEIPPDCALFSDDKCISTHGQFINEPPLVQLVDTTKYVLRGSKSKHILDNVHVLDTDFTKAVSSRIINDVIHIPVRCKRNIRLHEELFMDYGHIYDRDYITSLRV